MTADGISKFRIYQPSVNNQDGMIVDNMTFTPSSTDSPSAVPEPANWAMIVGGFGLLGATMRRRRGVVARAI